MAEERLRFGLIGCGGNMRAHIRRMVELPEVTIQAIVEPNVENVEKAFELYPDLAHTPGFTDHGEMLRQARPDAVVISTPHTYHAAQILDSLAAGSHVLCEKPMTCTVAEARAVCDAARESDRVMMVSYQRHQQALY